jgi:hypothetical protein
MKHVDAQALVLARMAASREELIVARRALGPVPVVRRPRSPSNVGPWLLRTPNAALFAMLLVGVVVLGPRRALHTALQAGLTTWTTRTARAFADSIKL